MVVSYRNVLMSMGLNKKGGGGYWVGTFVLLFIGDRKEGIECKRL